MKRALPLIAIGVLLMCAGEKVNALTLDALLQKTADNNPEIVKAKLELERASGQRIVLRAIAYPDVLVGAVGGAQGGYRAGQNKTQPFGFGYGGLTQALFNAAIPASLRRGNIEVLIAQQQLNVALTQHLHDARTAFYTGLYNRSLKQLREEQRDQLQEVAAGQKARYESGLAERSVFVGTQMQTRELNPRIETAQRGYDGAVLREAELMGDDLTGRTPLPRLEGELTFQPIEPDVDAAVATALQNRADLKLARLLVRAAEEDQRIIEAAYYPVINATVSGEYIPVSGVRRQSEGSPRRSDEFISSEIRAGAAYSWRVIDNGKVYGAVKKQRSVREINELLLKKMEADVPRELARLRNSLQALAAKRISVEQATSAADHLASTLKENLAGGLTSQLEFRLAENGLLDTKTALLGLAYQQNMALAEWDRATGRYFQFTDEPAGNTR